jgi:hypothetical protein
VVENIRDSDLHDNDFAFTELMHSYIEEVGEADKRYEVKKMQFWIGNFN